VTGAKKRRYPGANERKLIKACKAAFWIQDTDVAAIAALRQLAGELDALHKVRMEHDDLFGGTSSEIAGKVAYVEQTYQRFLKELGLTPKGFQELGFVTENREENPLDAIRANTVVQLAAVRTSDAEDRDASNSRG